jgi:hypothetical protein
MYDPLLCGLVGVSPADIRRLVLRELLRCNLPLEEAIELAILGGLAGTHGQALSSLVNSPHAPSIVSQTPRATQRAARQALLGGASLLGSWTAAELFAKIASKGVAGTTGVALGAGVRVPIAHHVVSVGCEARCELAILLLLRELGLPLDSVRKVWAFSESMWSGNLADRLAPTQHGATAIALLDEFGQPVSYHWHVAPAVLFQQELLVLDPTIDSSGPVSVAAWHHRLGTLNNHVGQQQDTAYLQAPWVDTPQGLRQLGVFGYAPIQEPSTHRECILDAAQQMNSTTLAHPLPQL